ncbi:MAG: hypothetical protein KGO47_07280 [Cyanobacteria bacterium REEB417]|nr:hypothetical protein [Cyanobacteria bacterium REEB417]
MGTLPAIPDLTLPEAKILQQAEGSQSAALKLAAAFGYRLACQDLDEVVRVTQPAPVAIEP